MPHIGITTFTSIHTLRQLSILFLFLYSCFMSITSLCNPFVQEK